jgi:predicted nucleic acid-binding protein
MRYLLDTPVVSEYLRKKPMQHVIEWLDAQEENRLFISRLTLAELKKGFHKLQYKAITKSEIKRTEKLASWLQHIESRFENRIVSVDGKVLDQWAMLCGQSEAVGKKLPVIDSLLVATARVHEMVAVTRNVEDFRNCSDQLDIFNPFSESP